MSKLAGIYCKAYYLRELRAFDGWRERDGQARPSGDDDRAPRTLDDDAIVYLQADLSVTDDIFVGEHVLFAGDDPQWHRFCADVLGFAVPEDVLEAERRVLADLAEAGD